MRVCDLAPTEIRAGMRIKDAFGTLGTIVHVDTDGYADIRWDGEWAPEEGFYGNECDYELIITPTTAFGAFGNSSP